jgi:prepilin-type N-terminal cleavage/methylation domain-containing protein
MKKNKGFTILEVVISLAVIGVSAGAVISLMNTYQKQVRNTEVKTGFEGAVSQALDEAHRVIRDTVDSSGNLTIGACSFMKTYHTSPGLGLIYVELPAEDPFKDEAKVWGWGSTKRTVFAPNSWESVECKDLNLGFTQIPNVWQRCFKPKNLETTPPLGLPIGLTPNDPIIRTVITPLRVRVEGKTDDKGVKLVSDAYKGYQAITLPKGESDKVDARDVAFLVTAELSYLQNPTDKIRTTKSQSLLRWLGEFQCHKVISSTNKLVLRPSGFGSGDDKYSLFSVSENSDDTVFDVKQKVKVFTEGKVVQERGVTLLEPENLAGAACIQKPVFTCSFRKKDENSWSNDSLSAVLNIKYNRENPVYKGSAIFVKPSLSLRRSSNTGDNGPDIPLPSNFYIPEATGEKNINAGLNITGSRLDIYSTATTPAASCSKLCSAENSFNQGANPYFLNYALNASSIKKTLDVSDTNSKVGCVCCYGKQCSAIGTKLQSWCGAQPPEALDSRVPECAADYDNPATALGLKDYRSLSGSQSNKKLKLGVNSPDANCLAAEKDSGEIAVSSESCESALNVLCYSQGRFILTPGKFTRNQAHQACYDLSAESILATEVDAKITSQRNAMSEATWQKIKGSVLPPIKNGRYTFRNAAMAGLFISPQEDVQLGSVLANSGIPNAKKFWIALRTNERGETVSTVPLMPANISPYVGHFDGDGRLVFFKEDNSNCSKNPADCLPFKSINSDGPVVLQHARTRFGAAIVDEKSVTDSFSAICLNPVTNTFFKTKATTKSHTDAIELCMKEEGVFVAPLRPLQWVAALLATKKTFNQLPFPIYLKNETLSAGVAWTGLLSKGSNFTQVLPEKPSDTCLVSSVFKGVSFNAESQKPEPDFHLARVGNSLTLASGKMPEGAGEEWIKNEEDFFNLSKEILQKRAPNMSIQIKECEKPKIKPEPEPAASGI